MRRVVVTAARSPLGRCVVAALRASSWVEHVCAVEGRPNRQGRAEPEIHVLPFAPDHRPFAHFLDQESIDTVIQCGLVPDRRGDVSNAREADVIGTLCLGAALGHEGASVRNWVLASSSGVYPIGSHSALLQRETVSLPREEESLASSIAEAEDYARDLAIRLPHVNVAILRLQQLIGPDVRGSLVSLLESDPTPALIGFDPPIQLLHLDDAASALAFATREELAGIYNVASSGTIRWNDAVDVSGHRRFPVLPLGAAPFEPLLKRLKIPFVPAALLDLMRFGHVVDTQKIEARGWKPQYDQVACLSYK